MSGIGGTEPTGYSEEAANSLKAKADNLQGKLYGQQGSRSSAVWTAMQDFRGYYSEVFDRNAETASSGRRAIASALGDVSRWVIELRDAAEAEDQRRAEARAWEERQRERENSWWRGGWHDFTSAIGFGDDPQPPAPEDPPHFTSPGVTVSGRDVAPPAGGSSTSSAVPENLRDFQRLSGELDDELSGSITDFENALNAYGVQCNGKWGHLDAQPVLTALNDWFAANGEDATWAGQLAQAFEDAGSGSGVTTVADSSIGAALASAGAGTHQREGITIEPFSAVGSPPTTGFADDPVNTSTGNFLEPETDLSFVGAAASLEFTRMYNSLDDRTSLFGLGWSSVLDTRLEFNDDGASFIMADGRQIDFPRAGAGWDRGVDENYWLHEVPASTVTRLKLTGGPDRVLVVTDNIGGWFAFSPSGRWLGSGRGPGATVSVVRDELGHITQLRHERGRYLDIEYLDGRVVSVISSDGRRIEYFYDEARRLIGVTNSVGTRSYRWNADGLVDQVVSASGVIEAENIYDSQGRVVRQFTPYGRSVRFAYLRGRVTSVSTDDGTGANTWVADRKGRVVGIIDADGRRQSMAYDPHGNIVSSTDRDGQVTVHAYDERGRRLRTVTPDGADINYGYDDFDRITTVVTAAGGVIEYEYAAEADINPSVIIDPMGGRSELLWENGLLKRVVDPEGVTISLEHDQFGELVAVINANGDTAKLIRDQTGQVIESISPSGHSTKFRYSDAGPLIAREDPDGAIWRFEHNTGGQVTAAIDPHGHRTAVEYGTHGEVIKQIDPLGRVTTRDFDELGNLASVILADGAQWEYNHDALSRLREIVDPAGSTWTYNYDVNGELLSTVDPTGVRADISRSRSSNLKTLTTAFEQFTLKTDEYGRLTKTEQTDGSAELISYDVAGRPVEIVDAEGGLTTVEYDLAGRITQITTPEHRTMRYEYDACGRPAAAIDPSGGRTVLEYDADSRVIARTNPVGEVSTITYDATGRVIRETIAGGGVARYRYDKLGRLVGVQDSRYGQRKFAYDAAGQLIKATNGLGGVTHYDYDVRGRMTRMIDPVGAVTVFTYTELDELQSVTDPLNRVTKATYDAAGRKVSQTDHDGNVTQWTYDAAGREDSASVNGKLITRIHRDAEQRRTVVDDMTQGVNAKVQHTLTYNRRGQLTHRVTARGAETEEMAWEYDADGYRIAMTTADGTQITTDRDRAGNVARLNHGTFGEIRCDYDTASRLRQARAGEFMQSWEYDRGYPVIHTFTWAEGTAVTRIVRDDQGRLIQLEGPGGTTRYTYDAACQLTSATNDDTTTTWGYDVAGRLTTETRDDRKYSYLYDQAGQLLLVKHPSGETTTYEYDGQGRRILEVSGENTTKYTWDPRGWLAQITQQHVDGQARVELSVNALGELTDVNDVRLQWDYAAGVPTLLGAGATSIFHGPAGLTATSDGWSANGWRAARATDPQNPFQTLSQITGLDGETAQSPIGLSADGSLHIGGLEWMGARAYDALSNAFLSMDPVPASVGVAWASNPYSYAGNDPLHAIDPHGLSPVTDGELQAYSESLQGPLTSARSAAGDWLGDNWEYVVGGLAIAGGVALMATGVGGPAGVALAMAGGAAIGGGVSVVSQQAQHGEVDWTRAGTDALIGGISGGAAGYAANGLRVAGGMAQSAAMSTTTAGARATVSQAARPILTNSTHRAALAGGTGGATNNVLNYHTYYDGDRTVAGYAQSAASGFGTGAVGSYGSAVLTPMTSRAGGALNITRSVTPTGRHGATEINMGAQGGTIIGDGLVGSGASAANTYLQPGDADRADYNRALFNGFISGGAGPSVGMHRDMSDWNPTP